MSKKQAARIHVEPKDQPPYDQMPEEARMAMADALLVLIQRGRQVLAEQVQAQLAAPKNAKESESQQ